MLFQQGTFPEWTTWYVITHTTTNFNYVGCTHILRLTADKYVHVRGFTKSKIQKGRISRLLSNPFLRLRFVVYTMCTIYTGKVLILHLLVKHLSSGTIKSVLRTQSKKKN